jgi:hypothetical protein
MGPDETEIKIDCAGEGQQQFTRLTETTLSWAGLRAQLMSLCE